MSGKTITIGVVGLLGGLLLAANGVSQAVSGAGLLERLSASACTGADCERSCRAGQSVACNEAGMSYLQGVGVPRSPEKAIALFRAGCEGGLPAACATLGTVLLESGEPSVRAEALGSLETACTRGEGTACNNLASAYDDGEGVPRDEKRGRALYEKACELGSGMGCSSLAKALTHEDPARSTKLFARAVERLKASCDAGTARACGQVGWLYERGLGAPLDGPRATAAYRRGCDGNDGLSCFNLALVREASDPTAEALRARACSLGAAEACRGAERTAEPAPQPAGGAAKIVAADAPATCRDLLARGELKAGVTQAECERTLGR